MLTGCAAVLPALLLLWFFSGRDRFPEPPRVIWTTFGLGVLTIIPAVLLETVLQSWGRGLTGLVGALFGAFFVAALVEEIFKLSVLQVYSFRNRQFNEPMDGVVYGAASGLGFAVLENLLYVMAPGGGLAVGTMRAVLSVPGHALWGAVLGFYAGTGRLCGRPLRGSLKGLAAAVALHGTFDTPVMLISDAGGTMPAGLGILLVIVVLAVSAAGWVWVLRLCRALRRQQAVEASQEPLPCPGPREVAEQPVGAAATIPNSCHHASLVRLAGVLLSAVGALLLAWAALVAASLAFAPGGGSQLVLGGLIVGGIPALAGALILAGGIRKLRQAGRR